MSSALRISAISVFALLLSWTGYVHAQYSDDWAHIPNSETFDVVTWNIEWFGDEDRGPNDTERQYNYVMSVILNLQPDLLAVQEIANRDQFRRLIGDLDGYSGFITNYSQPQQVGFIYNTETVDSLFSNLVDSDNGQSSYAWAGRFPLEFVVQARVGNSSRIIYAVAIHAKAEDSNQESYNRRVTASRDIKAYFDQSVTPHSALIFLGDYNDDVIRSIHGTFFDSPYKNFLDSPDYTIVTEPLSRRAAESWKRGTRTGSMIDHITINHHLHDYWLQGSEMVHVPDYISDFSNTTSDHRPVYARFDLSGTLNATSADEMRDSGEADMPGRSELLGNYPNPFNPVTAIPFHLQESSRITLSVYNALGQLVDRPISETQYQAGTHSISFNAENLPSGFYFYRLEDDSGWSQTRKMILVK